MRCAVFAFALGLLTVAAARADIPVPPPPGKKFVRVDHTITADKAYPDHEFYLLIGGTPKKVDFGPGAPVKIEGNRRNGPFGAAKLVAVPKGAATKYADEKEFAAALKTGKVEGQAATKHPFPNSVAVNAKDERKLLTEALVIDKIDAKEGIVLKAVPPPAGSPSPAKSDKNAPADESELTDEATAYTPRGGAAIAGLAGALALAFAGLWLVRRSRP